MNIAAKIVEFNGKIPVNRRNNRICKGILCEMNKRKKRNEKDFVQKAGVAVFLVKVAKKCCFRLFLVVS